MRLPNKLTRRILRSSAISLLVILNLRIKSFQPFESISPSSERKNIIPAPKKSIAYLVNNSLVLRQLRKLVSSQSQPPPRTPGAIVHVGKTGGSTLTAVLRNGCHSYLPKPCHSVPNETIVSRVTTYYHTPDWELLSKHTHDFYIWTVRDPFERTVSAFLYRHPFNVLVRRRTYKERVYHYRMLEMYTIYSRCFRSLNAFAKALKFNYIRKTDIDLEQAQQLNCDILANAMLQHRAKRVSEHLYYDTRLFFHQINQSKPTFALRTEFLWHDWRMINELLGQPPGSVGSPEVTRRNSSSLDLPVSSEIGDTEREYLCLAIEAEYKVYFQILSHAINIQEEDLEEMHLRCHFELPSARFVNSVRTSSAVTSSLKDDATVLPSARSWSISFSAAGHLIVYHLGVAKTLLFHAQRDLSLPAIKAVAGSSSGAVVAAAVACFPDRMEEYADRFLQDRGRGLSNFKEMLVEQNERKGGSARLGIATTRCSDGSLRLFHFDSPNGEHERLTKVLKASCTIPRHFHPWDVFTKFDLSYPNADGIEIDGEFYVDGGIASPCPLTDGIAEENATHIEVSPISGSSTTNWNIRPNDSSFKLLPLIGDLGARCGTFFVRPSIQNLRAAAVSAGVASPQVLSDWHQKGMDDANRFLETWRMGQQDLK
eukprot:scaffold781_cov132-Cylindrotheca_fusiformis.AAC.25